MNFYGNIVFDTLVKPCLNHDDKYTVVDFREWITGIKPIDLQQAPCFANIEPILKKIVKGKTIVGHSLADDLKILQVDPKELEIRDISDIELFMSKVDRDSRSPIKMSEDELSSPLRSPLKNFNQSGSSQKKMRKMKANYLIQKRKLKEISEEFLNAKIQEGHHSSIIDARAALALYRMNYEDIEIKYRCHEALQEVTKNFTTK